MPNQKPGLFGVKHSNRDFSQRETWGKNQFNSSFPIAMTSFLASKNQGCVYITLDNKVKIKHNILNVNDLYKIEPFSENLFFAFESSYTPYQQFLFGTLPRVDVVIQDRISGQALRALEIKLTALPDNTTCDLSEDKFGSEIVVRPDTIVYLAISILANFKETPFLLKKLFHQDFETIKDWSDATEIWSFIPRMVDVIDKIILQLIEEQEPFLMQPIWKTEGKSPMLSEHCLDVFVWSNLAFIQLFLSVGRGELNEKIKITRQIRTIIWFFKMIYDYAFDGQFNHEKIIDTLSYNTKNDKAFAVSGKITHIYMTCERLTKPLIRKEEIKDIIIGGGQNLLSPERRFDAIIHNTPDLFN